MDGRWGEGLGEEKREWKSGGVEREQTVSGQLKHKAVLSGRRRRRRKTENI